MSTTPAPGPPAGSGPRVRAVAPGVTAAGGRAGAGVTAEAAGVGRRFLAYLIDQLVASMIVVLGTTLSLVAMVLGDEPDAVEPTGAAALPQTISLVLALLFVLWNHGVRQGRTGQTIGKAALGIAVVRSDGVTPIGIGRAVARLLAQVLNSLTLLLGWLLALVDPRRRTLADLLVGTMVVPR